MHAKYQELAQLAGTDKFISVFDIKHEAGSRSTVHVDIYNNTQDQMIFKLTTDCYYITIDSRQVPLTHTHMGLTTFKILPYLFMRFIFDMWDSPRKFDSKDLIMISTTDPSGNILLSNLDKALKGRMIN